MKKTADIEKRTFFAAGGELRMVHSKRKEHCGIPEFLLPENTEKVERFHRTVPGYEVTPLVSLEDYAQAVGVKKVLVKDESGRFGLKAFKGLGGSFAIAEEIRRTVGLGEKELTFDMLMSDEVREKTRGMVFATATDGNHGKGISWFSGIIGCGSHVYMPEGSVEVRAEAIRQAGSAEVMITDMDYDDTVRYTAALAEKNGWHLMQDTSWDGYEEVPKDICKGYTTIFSEIKKQLSQLTECGEECVKPTHLFLQAGVGSMAGAILGAFAAEYGGKHPVTAIVEPHGAACIYGSAEKADGLPHKAEGSGKTIMAGLNCGEPCTVVWPVLRDMADFYFSVPDETARFGMRRLAHPFGNDTAIVSGESGASAFGLAAEILENHPEIREKLGINKDSVILAISTEGDTDPEAYEMITNA